MQNVKATARGFEPLRAEPNGFRVHLLSHSDTLSWLNLFVGAWHYFGLRVGAGVARHRLHMFAHQCTSVGNETQVGCAFRQPGLSHSPDCLKDIISKHCGNFSETGCQTRQNKSINAIMCEQLHTKTKQNT